MTIAIRAERHGDRGRLVPTGAMVLADAPAVRDDAARATATLDGCTAVDVDLSHLDRIDGSGAVLLAGLIDRLERAGCDARIETADNPEAARIVALYRRGLVQTATTVARKSQVLDRIGAAAAKLPRIAISALDFAGHSAAAFPKAVAAPWTVDWSSMPRLVQSIGADALPVTSAANLLVGMIIGFLGVSQLGRFGAVVYVPELVVVTHLRELGPLVTAIVVAGRAGAGLASELATMRVSEEVDALRSMGFDPVSWLVIPRCLALMITLPVLTWIGDAVALGGGLIATTTITDMTPRAYLLATADTLTGTNLLTGLVKTPFLALAIGLIACGQGLAARGGAAAVGARTTSAVVLAIFAVIVVSATFTMFYTLLGI